MITKHMFIHCSKIF